LGLALTKRIVEAQSGKVGVRSAPGTGSVFFAVLPRVFWAGREIAASAGAHPDARSATRPPATAGVRPDRRPDGRPAAAAEVRAPAVLVVDDDHESQKLVETALTELGYRPVCMPDGESGLRAATRERSSAVVLDLRMPGVSGLEFLDRLRQSDTGRTPPVIVST